MLANFRLSRYLISITALCCLNLITSELFAKMASILKLVKIVENVKIQILSNIHAIR